MEVRLLWTWGSCIEFMANNGEPGTWLGRMGRGGGRRERVEGRTEEEGGTRMAFRLWLLADEPGPTTLRQIGIPEMASTSQHARPLSPQIRYDLRLRPPARRSPGQLPNPSANLQFPLIDHPSASPQQSARPCPSPIRERFPPPKPRPPSPSPLPSVPAPAGVSRPSRPPPRRLAGGRPRPTRRPTHPSLGAREQSAPRPQKAHAYPRASCARSPSRNGASSLIPRRTEAPTRFPDFLTSPSIARLGAPPFSR